LLGKVLDASVIIETCSLSEDATTSRVARIKCAVVVVIANNRNSRETLASGRVTVIVCAGVVVGTFDRIDHAADELVLAGEWLAHVGERA